MDLVTLEDRITLSSLSAPTVSSSSPSQSNPAAVGTAVPHFSWLLNDKVLYDALGVQSRASYGSAFGQVTSLNKRASGIGFFTDRVGNRIIVVVENYTGDKPNAWHKTFMETGAYGRNPLYIDVARGQGDGHIEKVIVPQFKGGEALRNLKNVYSGSYNTTSVIDQLTQIESRGKRQDPIVVRVTGSPTTWRSVGALATEWLDVIIDLALQIGAPYLGNIVGVTSSQLMQAGPLLKSLAKGEPAQVTDLARAAALVATPEIRTYLNKATTFYEAVNNGNYAAAAQAAGINVGAVTAVKNGTIGNVNNSVNGLAQNVYIMNTVNAVRAKVRSGTAKAAIIDNGTMTKTPELQNLLLSAVASLNVGVPRVQEISGLAVTETSDIREPAEHRAMLQMAMGYPVTQGDLDRLALRGLIERAVTLREQGLKMMAMPAIVPPDKRAQWSREIAENTGVSVGDGSSSMLPLLAVAAGVGALYFIAK